MKRMMLLGCLCGILLPAACERLDRNRLRMEPDPTVIRHVTDSGATVIFTLDDVARLLACIPVGTDQVEEVLDAVSASAGNGYDEEYTMRNLFEVPGSGIGGAPATRVEAYPAPLRDLLAAEIRRQFGTRATDADDFLEALSASDVQLYWPYSGTFDTAQPPVITFDPGDDATRNIGYLRHEDGSVEELVVNEETARQRPVWVVSRNTDAEYKSLELRRREDPDWGSGGGSILVRSSGEEKDFKTLILHTIRVNRNFDSWFAGGSEIWVKVGAVEDFTASTEAELRLYSPSITDFLIVVRRSQVGQTLPFNAVLVSEWTGMLDNCALMIVEDDGGTQTSWKCSAVVKYNSKSYGFEIEIPLRTRDDIIWRGALTRNYVERYNGSVGHFGDVDLVLELI